VIDYPISDVIRPGLKIGDLTEEQHTAALAFLSAAMSPAGYQKFADITNADQVLADSGTNYAAGRPTASGSERGMCLSAIGLIGGSAGAANAVR